MSVNAPFPNDFQLRKLTGLRFSPLPSESSFSALTRLAWMNSFSHRDLVDYIIGKKRNIYHHLGFRCQNWVSSDLVKRLLGWTLPSDVEQEIAYKFDDNQRGVWNFDNLKFCPICLEGLYHSYWFQLEDQKICPLHQCELLTRCVCCGEISPSYHFEPTVFNSPYLCGACNMPFFGADPNIEAHEDLRGHFKTIESAFYNHEHWLARFDQKRFYEYFPKEEFYGWFRWCDRKSIRHFFINQASEIPPEIRSGVRNDLVVLEWRIQMIDGGIRSKRESFIFYNRRQIRCVMRVFLRNMMGWVFESVSATKRIRIMKKFRNEDVHNPLDYDPKHLAYMIVKEFNNWATAPRKSDIYPMSSWNNRIPRVAYLAYLYGFYAGICHRLRRLINKGQSAFEPIASLRVSDHLIAICDVTEDGVHAGRVIFPDIPGMPILLRFGRK